MRRTVMVLLFFGALAGSLAGCNGNQPAPTPPAQPSGGGSPPAGAALGTEQAAGPFQVTLSTDPDTPKAGNTKFEAKVTKGGQPVKDATVNLSLSMPSMSMMGPEVTLKPAGDEYEGAANLSMGGEWEAKVTVSAGGETGTAVYRFSASQ
jgi:nitrogen fixation protein FixH